VIASKLKEIKDRVLQYQPYFSAGYEDVVQDQTLGIVTNGDEAIFPNDTLGDYFYLRIPDVNQFRINNQYMIASCTGNGYETSSNIFLVACVRNADPDILVSNIVNILRTYNGLILRDWVHQSGVVVRRELAKMKDAESINAALARLDQNYTIVSVGFTLTYGMSTYTKPDCLPDPCKAC
jgi:hypothetical protein